MKKSQTPYILSNIFILNKNTGSSESLCIHLGFGLVLGYEVKIGILLILILVK